MTKLVASISVDSYGGIENRLFKYTVLDDQNITVGSIIVVYLRRKKSLGIVRQLHTDKSSIKLLSIETKLELAPLPSTYLQFIDWVKQYYQASDKALLTTALPSGLAAKLRQSIEHINSDNNIKLPFVLSPYQKKVYIEITHSSVRSHLIHGVTGSGKTEIYLALIADMIKQGQSALFLLPEIVLTPQMIARVERVFGKRVLCYHSKITAAARKAIWIHILQSTRPVIVVGTRSSLFLPYQNLGLIIVDEEHEPSYKQESSLRYHAREAAAKLAQIHNAKLVLGSATPSVTTYYLAERGKINLITLAQRFGKATLPETRIVSLKGSDNYLSPQLHKAIIETIKSGQQVLLFINRRGSAAALLCTDCGTAITCPNCETSLTFHADMARLLCHYCNYQQIPPALCNNCGSSELKYIGAGTKKLEQQMNLQYKDYRITRLDSDNASYDHLKDTLAKLASKQIDILIGTQMISRGLDFAGIGLVGVILAESVLNIADFSSSERTFELITQVAGRAGRGQVKSRVIIQTYSPDNFAIGAAAEHNYEKFYHQELQTRRKFVYPPFCYLLKLSHGHHRQIKASQTAHELAAQIASRYASATVLGPVESYQKKIAGKYFYNIIVKSFNRRELQEIAAVAGVNWSIDLDPITLL